MFLRKYLKHSFIFLLFLLILVSSSFCAHAQDEKSKKDIRKERKQEKKAKKDIEKALVDPNKHSPHKATIYSMILPGLGQAYNKKYWKMPIVYAGFGVMVYFISTNNKGYQDFKAAYDYVYKGDDTSPPPNEFAEKYSLTQLKNGRDIYRRNRDFSYIITGLWYLLNIVDASVDAHLFEFEVNDDLSFKIEPDVKIHPQELKPVTGLRVSFTLPFSKH